MDGVVKVSYLVSIPSGERTRVSLLYSAPASSPEQALELAQSFLAANKSLDRLKVSAVFVPHPVWVL